MHHAFQLMINIEQNVPSKMAVKLEYRTSSFDVSCPEIALQDLKIKFSKLTEY